MQYLISDNGAAIVPEQDAAYFIQRGFRVVERGDYWAQVERLLESERPAELTGDEPRLPNTHE